MTWLLKQMQKYQLKKQLKLTLKTEWRIGIKTKKNKNNFFQTISKLTNEVQSYATTKSRTNEM